MKSHITQSATRIKGRYSAPGDKSISHRAVMLASVASGISSFTNFLEADDCLRTIDAFRKMGVSIKKKGKKWTVKGVGFEGLHAPKQELYLGNSGTSIRLLLGMLAHQSFRAKLTGDPSLSKRPMRRVTDPLKKMGAHISGKQDANFAPLEIRGGKLKGIRHVNEPASAQVKSAILLAGLRAEGETLVQEPVSSRDHSERMLEMMGARIVSSPRAVRIYQTKKLKPIHYRIPGDISSAAFMIVAAVLLPGSELIVENVGLNPTRIGVLEILKKMGARIEWTIKSDTLEPSGTVLVRGSKLRGVTIEKGIIPKLIDELPILMIACALAKGKSIIRDAGELRVKETDRIFSMVRGLNAIGGKAEERADGCVIDGVSHFKGGKIKSYGDHRTVMSFAIAGLLSLKPITIEDVECVETSYPHFFNDLKKLAKQN